MENSIGKVLRQAREAANVSMDDVVYLGLVPRDVAEALEAEDFGFFSSPFYAKSFLEKYSAYLGVDAESWLNALELEPLIDGDSIDSMVEIEGPASNPLVERTKPRSGGGMASVSIVVMSGLLIFGGIKIYQNFEQKLAKPAVEEAVEEKVAEVVEEVEEVVIEEPQIEVTDTTPPRAIIVE